MKIAESLYLFINTHKINLTYIIHRGSFASLTRVKDLESSLAQGIGKEEVLAQLELFKSRTEDLEKLARKFNL